MAGSRHHAELALREDGVWIILAPVRTGQTYVDTGQVDRTLAELDLASWRTSGELSSIGRAWVQTAVRLRGNVAHGNWKQGGGERFTTERALHLLMEQDYTCPITGHRMEPHDGTKNPWQPSVDRVDSDKGYVAGNIRIVALIANLAMNTWGEAPLRELAERIVTPRIRPDPKSRPNVERVGRKENTRLLKPLRLRQLADAATSPGLAGV